MTIGCYDEQDIRDRENRNWWTSEGLREGQTISFREAAYPGDKPKRGMVTSIDSTWIEIDVFSDPHSRGPRLLSRILITVVRNGR